MSNGLFLASICGPSLDGMSFHRATIHADGIKLPNEVIVNMPPLRGTA